jgi:hypothetical protein
MCDKAAADSNKVSYSPRFKQEGPQERSKVTSEVLIGGSRPPSDYMFDVDRGETISSSGFLKLL